MLSTLSRRCLALASPLLLTSAVTATATATTATATATQTSTQAATSEAELLAIEAAFATPPPATNSAPAPGGFGAGLAAALNDMNPAMAVILDVAGGWFSGPPLQLGAHDPNRTGFTLQQLELALEANVDPYFAFKSNLVFAQFGVEVEEAYATTLDLPFGLQARAGQFLTRFGRINATHPHSWSFLDQPLVNGKFFGGEGSRGLGAEFSWLTPLPWFAELVVSATDPAGQCCARSFLGANDLGVARYSDLLHTLAVEQFFPLDDDWSIFWGLSGQLGPNASGNGNRTAIWGTDLYVRYRPVSSAKRTSLSLQAEAMLRERQVPGDVLQDFGMYAQLVWVFDLRFETALRFEHVSGVERDPLDPEWSDARKRLTAQLTHYPSHFSRLRLQAASTLPGGGREPVWALLLGLEVLVGAHGAHVF